MIEAEKRREAARIVERLGSEQTMDLEAVEFFVRAAMLKAGAGALETFLESSLRNEQAPVCGDNHLPETMRNTGRRQKRIRTILGPVRIRRTRFVCPVCGAVRYPADETLGVERTSFSPGAQRMMARAGASEPFGQAAQDLELYASLRVDAKDVERVAEATGEEVDAWRGAEASRAVGRAGCGQAVVDEPPETLYVSFDGTGAPMRREEVEGVKGKGPDGRARTREVKLGCVFTQTGVDDKGRPVRDEASTTYTGAIEASVEFGHRIHGEATRRGLGQARRVVAITDGAGYNKTIIAEHFPHATHIIDLYHAREHLADFARDAARIGLDSAWFVKARRTLDQGRIARLTAMMRQVLARSGPRRKLGLTQIGYFRHNARQMRYERFRQEGLFVGSGVIEAGCRTIVGQRLKRSGMFWSVRGANAILALRTCLQSGLFEQFWESEGLKASA